MSQRRETRDERARPVDPSACLCAVVRLPTAVPVLIDNDAESLAQLRNRATRVTLRGSQSLRLDLRVVKVR